MFLTRQQYDYLVTNCAAWMNLRWSEYSKRWSINGVHVTGSDAAIENLRWQFAADFDLIDDNGQLIVR